MLVLGREQHNIITWKHIIYMLMRDTKAPLLGNDAQNSNITV